MIKRPAFQFYPGDWLRSTDLRSCSLEARGLWMDMMCLMHEGLPYGYLKVKDKVILPSNLARMVGTTLENIEGLLKELEESGVLSRDESGCIYSRRMKRDEEVRNKRAAGGIKGGNPALMKVKRRLTLEKTLGITPATASAIAIASTNTSDPLILEDKLNNSDPISLATRARKMNQDFALGTILHFDRFRQAYPKPGSWVKAEIEWRTKNCDAVVEDILADIPKRKAKDQQWQETRFIPNPENYLKNEVWKNDIIPKSDKTTGNTAFSGKTLVQLKAEERERRRLEGQIDDE